MTNRENSDLLQVLNVGRGELLSLLRALSADETLSAPELAPAAAIAEACEILLSAAPAPYGSGEARILELCLSGR